MSDEICAIRVNDTVTFETGRNSEMAGIKMESGIVTCVTKARGGFLISILSCGRTFVRYADRVTLIVPVRSSDGE
jgi:hypothetical protein